MKYNIYALIDPRNNNVFYIGATRQALHTRLQGHLFKLSGKSKNNSLSDQRKETIFSILKSKKQVIIKLLEVTDSNSVRMLEESYYYKYFNLGHKLLQSANHFSYCQYHYLSKKEPGKAIGIPIPNKLYAILQKQPEIMLGISRNKTLNILIAEALNAREAKKSKK